MDGQDTVIGDYVTIGHNAIIHCGKIGDNCLIGMGYIDAEQVLRLAQPLKKNDYGKYLEQIAKE